MGLSSQLAPSAIAKPGVCTSSTRPASPYEGQVIYETDTDKTLVWNGSAWVYLSTGTANPPGLEFIAQTTYSASSAVNLDNCFGASFDNYLIVNSCYGSANSNVRLKYRLAGVTNSDNVYYTGGLYFNPPSSTGYIYDWPVTTGHFLGNYGSPSTEHGTQMVTLWNPNKAIKNTLYSQWESGQSGLGGFNNAVIASTSQFDGFALIPGSGTITGTVRVYGMKQS